MICAFLMYELSVKMPFLVDRILLKKKRPNDMICLSYMSTRYLKLVPGSRSPRWRKWHPPSLHTVVAVLFGANRAENVCLFMGITKRKTQ